MPIIDKTAIWKEGTTKPMGMEPVDFPSKAKVQTTKAIYVCSVCKSPYCTDSNDELPSHCPVCCVSCSWDKRETSPERTYTSGSQKTPHPSDSKEQRLRSRAESGRDKHDMFEYALWLKNAGRTLEAHTWFCRAAEQGHAKAAWEVAKKLGEVPEAFRWCQQAWDAEIVEAGIPLSNMFRKGIGCPEDTMTAAIILIKAVAKGDKSAVTLSKKYADNGSMYDQYLYAITQRSENNIDECRKYLLMSAELGFAPAQCEYGKMVSKESRRLAKKWLKKAIDQGDGDAMLALGLIYMEGNRHKQAKTLLERASALGVEGSSEAIDLFNEKVEKHNNWILVCNICAFIGYILYRMAS